MRSIFIQLQVKFALNEQIRAKISTSILLINTLSKAQLACRFTFFIGIIALTLYSAVPEEDSGFPTLLVAIIAAIGGVFLSLSATIIIIVTMRVRKGE